MFKLKPTIFDGAGIAKKIFYCSFSTLIIFFFTLIFSMNQSSKVAFSSYEKSFLDIIARTLLAPTIETLIFQLLPFFIAKRWNFHYLLTASIMAFAFACAHYYLGLAGVLAAFIAGFIFSISFIFWSKNSLYQAFFITASIHVLHNILAEIWNSFFV